MVSFNSFLATFDTNMVVFCTKFQSYEGMCWAGSGGERSVEEREGVCI